MWNALLSVLYLGVSVRGNGLFGNLFRDHRISTTTSYSDYTVVNYGIYSSTKPPVGAFWGMPPPPDSPYLGTIATTTTIIYPGFGLFSSSTPKPEDWFYRTTERPPPSTVHYHTTEPCDHRSFPLSSHFPYWPGGVPGLRTTESPPLRVNGGSSEEEGWNTLPFKDKTTEKGLGKDKKGNKWCKRCQSKCKSSKREASGISIRITGGQPAPPKKHPHMVMIGYGSIGKREWLCGGSLISERFVLSAAHCVNTSRMGQARWARMGDLDISTDTEDALPQDREIIERIVHPEYKEPAVYHDIVLFKLDRDVIITDWVSPVCLHREKSIPSTVATITGWGRTDFVSETSPTLMEVDVTVFNSSFCKELVDKSAGAKMPKGFDTKVMVCAGEEKGGKDACQGDSGGPLVISSGCCSRIQIGITSVGKECGLPNSPGVYTRVSNYIQWIEEIVWR